MQNADSLTDLLEPGRDANPRDAVQLRLYTQGRLSARSREYRHLMWIGYLTDDGRLTYTGKNVLKHLKLSEEAREQAKRNRRELRRDKPERSDN
jgi:hypothetical protein